MLAALVTKYLLNKVYWNTIRQILKINFLFQKYFFFGLEVRAGPD